VIATLRQNNTIDQVSTIILHKLDHDEPNKETGHPLDLGDSRAESEED